MQWQGSNNPPDYITVARPEQEEVAYLQYTYTKTGSLLKLQMPSEPGNYESRYILGHNKRLAQIPITVQPVEAGVQTPEAANAADRIDVAWQGSINRGQS